MKRFSGLVMAGAAGAFCASLGFGILADRLIASWKFETAGRMSLFAGTAFGLLAQLLNLPAIALSSLSDRTSFMIVALVFNFMLWGLAFAFFVERRRVRRQRT